MGLISLECGSELESEKNFYFILFKLKTTTSIKFFASGREIVYLKECIVERYSASDFILDCRIRERKCIPNLRSLENKRNYVNVVDVDLEINLEEYFIYYFRENHPHCENNDVFCEKVLNALEFSNEESKRSSISVIDNDEVEVLIIYYFPESLIENSRFYLTIFEESLLLNERSLKYKSFLSFSNWILAKINLILEIPHAYSTDFMFHRKTNSYRIDGKTKMIVNVTDYSYFHEDFIFSMFFGKPLDETNFPEEGNLVFSKLPSPDKTKKVFLEIVGKIEECSGFFRKKTQEKICSFRGEGYFSFIISKIILPRI